MKVVIEDLGVEPVLQAIIEADTLCKENKFGEVERIYKALAFIFEDNFALQFNWVLCLFESEKFDEAIETATQLLIKSPENKELQILLNAAQWQQSWELSQSNQSE